MDGSRAIIAAAAFALALACISAAARGETAPNPARMAAPDSPQSAEPMRRFPPGCTVTVGGRRDGSRWLLPRATLVVANRSPHRLTIRMEARAEVETAQMDLTPLETGETRTFRHVVPAGRSVALAHRHDNGAPLTRQPIYIWNQGPLTCQRRFVWVVH